MRGHRVTIYERMASPARKFLLAGRGGLNLTHSEGLDEFLNGTAATRATSAPLSRVSRRTNSSRGRMASAPILSSEQAAAYFRAR